MVTMNKKLWLVAVAAMTTATVTHPLSLPGGDWFKRNIGLVVGGAVLCVAAVMGYKKFRETQPKKTFQAYAQVNVEKIAAKGAKEKEEARKKAEALIKEAAEKVAAEYLAKEKAEAFKKAEAEKAYLARRKQAYIKQKAEEQAEAEAEKKAKDRRERRERVLEAEDRRLIAVAEKKEKEEQASSFAKAAADKAAKEAEEKAEADRLAKEEKARKEAEVKRLEEEKAEAERLAQEKADEIKQNSCELIRAVKNGESDECERLLKLENIDINYQFDGGVALEYATIYCRNFPDDKNRQEIFKLIATKYEYRVLGDLIDQCKKSVNSYSYRTVIMLLNELLIKESYEILGVKSTASGEDIKAAHDKLESELQRDENYESNKEELYAAYNRIIMPLVAKSYAILTIDSEKPVNSNTSGTDIAKNYEQLVKKPNSDKAELDAAYNCIRDFRLKQKSKK